MGSTFSLSFDDVAEQIKNSLWFNSSLMTLQRMEGYRAAGAFGLKQGSRMTPSGFYATLARCFLAVKINGPACLKANDFGDYHPKNASELGYILAVQFHLESSDNMELSQRQFWKAHGKELMFHPDLVAIAGGERMAALANLEKEFYSYCEAIELEELMDLHMDVCRELQSNIKG